MLWLYSTDSLRLSEKIFECETVDS